MAPAPEPLTEWEGDAKDAFLAGDWIDLGGHGSIRGTFLQQLCMAEWRSGRNLNLHVRNGSIEGDLMFNSVRFDADVELHTVTLGRLYLARATLNVLVMTNCEVERIEAVGLETTRGVDLNSKNGGQFRSHGRVRLVAARIGGDLNCEKAVFGRSENDREKGWSALSLDSARVAGNVRLRGVRADGRGSAWGVRVGGAFDCRQATFASNQRRLLNLRQATVGQGGDFSDCEATGRVDVRGANFGGRVSFEGAKIASDLWLQNCKVDGDLVLKNVTLGGPRLDLSGVRVAGSLSARAVKPASPARLRIELQSVTVGELDDGPGSWPERDKDDHYLDGMTIPALRQPHLDWRIGWLQRNAIWTPQPWQEVSAALRRYGHDDEAREIAIEREKERTRRGRRPGWLLWRWILHWTIGYGYKPARAVLWALAIVGLCAALFTRADFVSDAGAPASATILYSIDAFLPVDLGYFSTWTPKEASWNALAVFEAASGWLLAALLLGALTGLLKKD